MKLKYIYLVLIFFVSSCRDQDSSNTSRKSLNLEVSASISTLDPAVCYDTVCNKPVPQMYEALYEYHYLKRPYELRPLLAEDMPSVSADGLTYTIKIKKNIFYHKDPCFHGKLQTVKAIDFIHQIKRLAFISTKSRGWWIFENKIPGLDEFREKVGTDFKKFFTTPVAGLQAPDDHTLVIKLNRPHPQLIYGLAMSFTTPIPEEAIRAYENDLSEKVIGTGPFYLDKWVRDSKLTIKRFEHYRDEYYPKIGDRTANQEGLLKDAGKKIPFLDEITFHDLHESQTSWLNFRSQKIDLIVVPKDNFTSVITTTGTLTEDMTKQGVQLHVANTLVYWWLSFNMRDPILGRNLLLRQAIAHAIDWDQYISIFTNNIGQRANSIYPPGIPGYSPTRNLPYNYNVKKAEELLNQAGYPRGQGLPIFNFDVRTNATLARQQGEYIKKELEKIGIRINVITNTFPGFLKKAQEGQLQFWQDGWSLDYPDAENILGLLISQNHPPGANYTYYRNSKVDQIYNQIVSLRDGEEKYKLMEQVEDITTAELPWIMQYYMRQYIVLHGRLKNFRHSDIINNYVKYLRVE